MRATWARADAGCRRRQRTCKSGEAEGDCTRRGTDESVPIRSWRYVAVEERVFDSVGFEAGGQVFGDRHNIAGFLPRSRTSTQKGSMTLVALGLPSSKQEEHFALGSISQGLTFWSPSA